LPNGEILAVVRDITERKRTERQLATLSARLLKAQDEERKALARELHDEFGQSLAVAKFAAHRLRSKISAAQPDLRQVTDQLCSDIDAAIKIVRTIQSGLHPIVLDHLGLIPAIETLVSTFEGRTEIACSLDIEDRQPAIEPERQLHLYRILQEALTNVARHADASEVEIAIRKNDGQFHLQIRDNGRGITPTQAQGPGSSGVTGMRQRAEQCGGSFHIRGGATGTVITIQMPFTSANGGGENGPAAGDDWGTNI
jgi:signal transduction histidine kinase